MRSIALACAVKGGREIVIIGHTDCKVRHTSIGELTERFKALGIERHQLPENLTEYFGVFASERQNVIRSVDFIRQSPLIGPRIPVQGLLADVQTGKRMGYQQLRSFRASKSPRLPTCLPTLGGVVRKTWRPALIQFGEMKFPT